MDRRDRTQRVAMQAAEDLTRARKMELLGQHGLEVLALLVDDLQIVEECSRGACRLVITTPTTPKGER